MLGPGLGVQDVSRAFPEAGQSQSLGSFCKAPPHRLAATGQGRVLLGAWSGGEQAEGLPGDRWSPGRGAWARPLGSQEGTGRVSERTTRWAGTFNFRVKMSRRAKVAKMVVGMQRGTPASF